jgi:hypothetical protein
VVQHNVGRLQLFVVLQRYKEWASQLKLSLRTFTSPATSCFVDYSGHAMEVIDALTGESASIRPIKASCCASMRRARFKLWNVRSRCRRSL